MIYRIHFRFPSPPCCPRSSCSRGANQRIYTIKKTFSYPLLLAVLVLLAAGDQENLLCRLHYNKIVRLKIYPQIQKKYYILYSAAFTGPLIGVLFSAVLYFIHVTSTRMNPLLLLGTRLHYYERVTVVRYYYYRLGYLFFFVKTYQKSTFFNFLRTFS